ncbi:MAG TPA: extracellular solute-binding protein [Clostridiaceae bacterium]|nr:extracellular solute-binding protein [Clostridiaceae bacterium]
MKKQIVKLLSMLVAVAVFISLLVGCGSRNTNSDVSAENKTTTSTEGETENETEKQTSEALKEVKLRFFFGGDKKEATDEVWQAISEKYKDKLNATFEINYVPFGDYANKLIVMASSGDNWDMNFDGDWLVYPQMVNKGAYLALNDLLPEYAPDLYATYQSSGVLEAATVNGNILCLPWTMKQNQRGYLMWRKDLLPKDGFDIKTDSIKTIEDIDKVLNDAKKAFPNLRIFNISTQGGFPYAVGLITQLKYELADLSFHGFVFDMNDPDIKVIPFEQTQAFKEAVEYAKKWYDAGIIPKDAVIDKTDINTFFDQGKAFLTYSTHEWSSVVKNYTNGIETDRSQLYPEKKFYNRTPLANVVAINKNAANPERVLMFMNLLETDREFYDMVLYGIPGKTYVLDGEAAAYPEGMDTSNGNYLDWPSQWAFWKPQFMRPTTQYPSGFWQREAEFASQPNNINSPLYGLFFDSENIKNEIAKRDQIQDEFGKLLLLGVCKDVDQSVADYIEKQKAAGVDKITAELQKQVDAFLASKK